MTPIDLDRLTAQQAVADVRGGAYSARALTEACQARIDQRNGALSALMPGTARWRWSAPAASTPPCATTAPWPTPPWTRACAPQAPSCRARPICPNWRARRTAGAGCSATRATPGTPAARPAARPVAARLARRWLWPVASRCWTWGSDIGGSIRIPGIAALKATEGRIPRTGQGHGARHAPLQPRAPHAGGADRRPGPLSGRLRCGPVPGGAHRALPRASHAGLEAAAAHRRGREAVLPYFEATVWRLRSRSPAIRW